MSTELWSVKEIATWAKVSERHVRRELVQQPWFPRPLALGAKHRRWIQEEVVEAVTSHRAY